MLQPIDDTFYSAEERTMLLHMRDFFNIKSQCLECIQKLLPSWFTETYEAETELLGKVILNVKRARLLVRQTRPTLMMLTPHMLRTLPATNVIHYDPRHLPHIPLEKCVEPGILLTTRHVDRQPEVMLIDGSHRAARCIVTETPFYAYRLEQQYAYALQYTDDDIQNAVQQLERSGFSQYHRTL
jgi:hypothetical protein